MESYIYERIKNEVLNELEEIDTKHFEEGNAFFNRKCVDNSADEYLCEGEIPDKDSKMVMFMCIDEWGSMWLHAINKVGEKYIDNTLGYRYKHIRYFYVKDFPTDLESSYQFRTFFNNHRDYLVKKHQAYFDLRTIKGSDLI